MKRRVAVDKDRDDFLAVSRIVQHTLARAGLALHHRVHRFEVTRIRSEADFHLIACRGRAHVAITKVILHVAIAADGIRREIALELVENDVERLVENIGEDVETAAMGHSHDQAP